MGTNWITRVDPTRTDRHGQTGIYVRAMHNDKWGSHDIAELDRYSLVAWLNSQRPIGLAANVVIILLGHDHPVEQREKARQALADKGSAAMALDIYGTNKAHDDDELVVAARNLAREVLADTTTSTLLNDMANALLDMVHP